MSWARTALPAIALALSFVGCTTNRKLAPHGPPCLLRCKADRSCDRLDAQLVGARRPLLRCVGDEARRGHLDRAHRCYRALRLVESARWWLRTMASDTGILPPVYRVPVESMRQEFLCRIERLSAARTPAAIERLYDDIIQAYP